MKEALGIPSSGYEYIKMLPNKDNVTERLDMLEKINEFLVNVASSDLMPEFQGKDKRLQFINYGDTELVYVLTVDNRKYTMLLGQPITKFGAVKQEYENLKALCRRNKQNIVEPMQYFKDEESKQELYVTPYLYQARCIGIEEKDWGIWIPEPIYHFKDFTRLEKNLINSSMIALLIKLYDDKNNLGIGECKIGGGDFILEKGFEDEEITYENILKRLKLIAARKLIPMSLDEYVRKIQEEFSKITYYKTEDEMDKTLIINHKARAPMELGEIKNGIELGYKLRERALKEQEDVR